MRRRALLSTGALTLLSACGSGDFRREAESQVPETRAPDARNPEPPDPETLDPETLDPAAAEPGGAEPAPELPELDPAAYSTSPAEWGDNVTGVKTRLATDRPVMALTFDACGGDGGSGEDESLVEFLIDQQIPATLFFNARWIEVNRDRFVELAQNPLFAIGNHGAAHRPLSVTGKSVYGIGGTRSAAEVIDEIAGCQELIQRLSGLWPTWFRSGTAYCDEVAVQIAGDLGLEVVNYDVLGDAGATLSETEVATSLESATAGSIALLHMNRPSGDTAEGVRAAVPTLRERGKRFVRLDEYPLA